MKTAAILMAATMALMAFAPVTSADNPGDLSRTFLSSMNIEWKPHSTNSGDGIGGAGWYHPDQRDDLCFLRLFGFTNGVFYYDGIPKPRVTTNFNEHVAHVSEQSEEFLPPAGTCPFDSTLPDGQIIGTSAFNVWAASGVDQSFLFCLKTFSLCAPDPNTADWDLYYCNGHSGQQGIDPIPDPTGTSDSVKNKNRVTFQKGDIIGTSTLPAPLNALAPTLGSSSIGTGCTVGVDDGVFGYDVSDRLSEQLNNLASLDPIHVDEFSPSDEDDKDEPKPTRTSYWLSQFSVDIFEFPPGTVRTSCTHDYFLVLDDDDPENWPGALIYHELAPTDDPKTDKKYPVTPNSILEQGLYDLSGDNGCKNPDATTLLPENKPKNNPIVPP